MNKIDEKYKAEEQGYWKRFHEELNRLKEQLEATDVELAEGLGISRQSLFTFMSSPDEKKLPIYRSNILQLWDRLTDIERIQASKRLSDKAKHNRKKFRDEGLETLLNAAGFTNITSKQHYLDTNSNKNPFVESIINRLYNLNFDDAGFYKLTTDIENQISNSINTRTKEITDVNKKELEKWIKETFRNSTDSLKNEFLHQIQQYESLGKTKFTSVELYELYMSILENQNFFNNTNEYLRFTVINCNFNTLTFSIQKYNCDNCEDSWFKDILDKIEEKANKYLGQDTKSSPVINASITCYSEGKQEYINWHFISSGTHITNLLSAVEHGMGYGSSILELTDLSIKFLGRKSHGLAKIIVGLSEVNNKKSYQGSWVRSWVSNNTIAGTVQAAVNAGTGWLSSIFKTDKDCQEYYKNCKRIAEIQGEVALINKLLNEYILEDKSRQDGKTISVIERCSNIISEISKLQEKLAGYNNIVFDLYEKYLDKTIHTVKLLYLYAALLKGDLEKVKDWQTDALEYFRKPEKYEPIIVLYNTVGMVYQFLSGDKALLNKKQWRDQEQFNDTLHKLRNYIRTGAIGDKSSNGYIDVTEYRSASEYFGNISTIEFYVCTSKDIFEFKQNDQQSPETAIQYNIIDNFLVAAYYAAKIGQKQRTVHWLLMASRAYCRLKENDKARTLIKVAEAILDEAIEPKYFLKYKESIKTEVELVRGEIFLIEENYEKALEHFYKSLKGSLYLELILSAADNLYNIFRAAGKLKPKESYELDKDFFPSEEEYLEYSKTSKTVIDFLKNIGKPEQANSKEFKNQAQKIWQQWFLNKSHSHTKDEKHIIVEMIENGTFLDYLAEARK